MSIFSKLKNNLINLYLSPLERNYSLGLSSRNRIFRNQLHLIGLIVSLQKINRNNLKGLILDIGCHRGDTSFFFAKHFRNLNIIGFEPFKESFEAAQQQVGSHPNVKFEKIAISDSDGSADLFKANNEVSSSLNKINDNSEFSTIDKEKVTVNKLDTYLKDKNLSGEKILALKIDVQGHELNVLRGAGESLKNTLFILLEMANHDDYEGGAKYYEADEYLRSKDFVLQNIFTPFSPGQVYEYDAIYMNRQLSKNYFD